MASFTVIRPRDDAMTQQCADWADDFCTDAQTHGHNLGIDLDGAYTSVDQPAVLAAVHQPANLVLYFGHGDTDCWLTVIQRTVESSNVSAISGKPVVSVACKTACILAGAAITAGATAWLGFTISVPVLAPHRNVDPIGESLVRGLSALARGGSMQQARDDVADAFGQLARDFDTGGRLASRPDKVLGYFASIAVRDHVVVQGNVALAPL